MNIVIGFGQTHVEETKSFANEIGKRLLQQDGDPEEVAKEMAAELGTFKDKGWPLAHIRSVDVTENWRPVIVVEGTRSHFRDDHPVSPDGYASWNHTFCVVVMIDDIWGPRYYVSVEGGES